MKLKQQFTPLENATRLAAERISTIRTRSRMLRASSLMGFIIVGSILSLALFVWTAPVQAADDLIDVVEILDPAPFIIHMDILPGDSFLHPMTVRNLTDSPQDVGVKLDIDLSQGLVPNPPFELEEQIFVKIERVGSGFIELPGGGQEKTLQELDNTLIELGIIAGASTQLYNISFIFNPNAGNEYQNTKVYFNVTMGLEILDTRASLQIEKTNDSTGPQLPGDIVTYTLKVTALNNDVNDVVLTDLPPEGFVYIPGSGFGAPFIHPYASPGVWDLGDLAQGESKTVTYRTRISGTQGEGLYRDLAWAEGTADAGGSILALDPIDLDNFVGTQVAVALSTSEQIALEEREETDTTTKRETRQVIGSTKTLPATGSNTWWIILAGFLAALGGILMYFGRRKKIQASFSIKTIIKVFILALFGLALFEFSEIARAVTPDPNISVRIEDPKSPTNTSTFKIGFVTLDIQGRDLSVQCYEETSGSITTEYNHRDGGNSGNCAVDSFADGSYKFYVIASIDGDSTESSHVMVEIKSGTPGTPFNYDRDGDSCNLSFTTANDGLTAKVELYRSKDNEFTADSSTFSTSIAVGPNTSGSMNDPLGNCDDYLYAIRAVSAAGIGSGFVGDEKVTVLQRTETITTTETTNPTVQAGSGGANPVTGGGGEISPPGVSETPAVTEPTPEALPLFDVSAEPVRQCRGWPLWVWILALIIFTLNFWQNTRKNYWLEEYGWKVALAWTMAGVAFWYYFDFCREYLWFLYGAIIIAIVSHFVYLYYLRKKINEIEKNSENNRQ